MTLGFQVAFAHQQFVENLELLTPWVPNQETRVRLLYGGLPDREQLLALDLLLAPVGSCGAVRGRPHGPDGRHACSLTSRTSTAF